VEGGLAQIYKALEWTSKRKALTAIEIGKKLFPDLDPNLAKHRSNDYLQRAWEPMRSDETGIEIFSIVEPGHKKGSEAKYYSKPKIPIPPK
jgi:hypothetical protein